MCEKCLQAFKEVFPDKPEDEAFNVLVNFTSFPFGEPEQIRQQLIELRDHPEANEDGAA
jgi:hypothetical protein